VCVATKQARAIFGNNHWIALLSPASDEKSTVRLLDLITSYIAADARSASITRPAGRLSFGIVMSGKTPRAYHPSSKHGSMV